MSELDKKAEMWTQSRFGSIAIRFHGDTEYRPHPTIDAYKAGALEERAQMLKYLDETEDNAASGNNDWNNGYLEGKRALIRELKAKLGGK